MTIHILDGNGKHVERPRYPDDYCGFCITYNRNTAYATLLNADGSLADVELSDERGPDGSSNIHGLIDEWIEGQRVTAENDRLVAELEASPPYRNAAKGGM